MLEKLPVQKHHFWKYFRASLLNFLIPSRHLAEDMVFGLQISSPYYGLNIPAVRRARVEAVKEIIENSRRFNLQIQPDDTPDLLCDVCINRECPISITSRGQDNMSE